MNDKCLPSYSRCRSPVDVATRIRLRLAEVSFVLSGRDMGRRSSSRGPEFGGGEGWNDKPHPVSCFPHGCAVVGLLRPSERSAPNGRDYTPRTTENSTGMVWSGAAPPLHAPRSWGISDVHSLTRVKSRPV